MTSDKQFLLDVRRLRDLGVQLFAKGNELMKLGAELHQLVDAVTAQKFDLEGYHLRKMYDADTRAMEREFIRQLKAKPKPRRRKR